MFKIDSQHAQNVGDDYNHNQDQNGYQHGAETRQKTLKQDSNLQHQSEGTLGGKESLIEIVAPTHLTFHRLVWLWVGAGGGGLGE